jgi:glycosyltransferase involved in cell wall biosynthesis
MDSLSCSLLHCREGSKKLFWRAIKRRKQTMLSKLKDRASRTFVTLFPTATDIHLVKDVGQIPYILARDFGYDSTLVSESDSPFENLQSDTPGLAVKRISRWPGTGQLPVASFVYLLRQARHIDILNLYHMRLQTKLAALLYKALNPKGFVYVKLDMDIVAERDALHQPAKPKSLRSVLRDLLNHRFFTAVDLFSAESRQAVELAGMRYPAIRTKTIEVTNGLDLSRVQAQCPPLGYEQKEDLIITVGRLGTYQKNTEALLDSLKRVRLGHWKVALIGPYSPDFRDNFEALLRERPDLADAVHLVGNVRNRQQLMSWYSRAKAFVLTSRFEGFPLIFGEAQSYGNYMISTDVSSIREILMGERYGRVIDPAAGHTLEVLLEEFTENPVYTSELVNELVAYAANKYEWRQILEPLNKRMEAGRCA